jgi:hypothetical protein
VNEKIMTFLKKALAYIQKNWLVFVIIGGLLLLSGGINSCAQKKIAAKDVEIAQLQKDNTAKDNALKAREKDYAELDKKEKNSEKKIADLEKEKADIAAAKTKKDKQYADLLKKYGSLSLAEQDQLLVDLLKKYDIVAEVRNNLLVITMTDRGKLYTFVVDIDKVKSDLKFSEEALVNCKATVQEKNNIITIKEQTIVLKDKDIQDYKDKIVNFEQIIKDQKDKIFWTKVSSFTKKAIPALIIGLVVGFLVAK